MAGDDEKNQEKQEKEEKEEKKKQKQKEKDKDKEKEKEEKKKQKEQEEKEKAAIQKKIDALQSKVDSAIDSRDKKSEKLHDQIKEARAKAKELNKEGKDGEKWEKEAKKLEESFDDVKKAFQEEFKKLSEQAKEIDPKAKLSTSKKSGGNQDDKIKKEKERYQKDLGVIERKIAQLEKKFKDLEEKIKDGETDEKKLEQLEKLRSDIDSEKTKKSNLRSDHAQKLKELGGSVGAKDGEVEGITKARKAAIDRLNAERDKVSESFNAKIQSVEEADGDDISKKVKIKQLQEEKRCAEAIIKEKQKLIQVANFARNILGQYSPKNTEDQIFEYRKQCAKHKARTKYEAEVYSLRLRIKAASGDEQVALKTQLQTVKDKQMEGLAKIDRTEWNSIIRFIIPPHDRDAQRTKALKKLEDKFNTKQQNIRLSMEIAEMELDEAYQKDAKPKVIQKINKRLEQLEEETKKNDVWYSKNRGLITADPDFGKRDGKWLAKMVFVAFLALLFLPFTLLGGLLYIIYVRYRASVTVNLDKKATAKAAESGAPNKAVRKSSMAEITSTKEGALDAAVVELAKGEHGDKIKALQNAMVGILTAPLDFDISSHEEKFNEVFSEIPTELERRALANAKSGDHYPLERVINHLIRDRSSNDEDDRKIATRRLELAKKLLQEGASPFTRMSNGMSPMGHLVSSEEFIMKHESFAVDLLELMEGSQVHHNWIDERRPDEGEEPTPPPLKDTVTFTSLNSKNASLMYLVLVSPIPRRLKVKFLSLMKSAQADPNKPVGVEKKSMLLRLLRQWMESSKVSDIEVLDEAIDIFYDTFREKIDFSVSNKENRNALMVVCSTPRLGEGQNRDTMKLTRRFLKEMEDKKLDLNQQDIYGASAYLLACSSGWWNVVESFEKISGIDCDIRDARSLGRLFYSAMAEDSTVLKHQIVKAKKDREIAKKKGDLVPIFDAYDIQHSYVPIARHAEKSGDMAIIDLISTVAHPFAPVWSAPKLFRKRMKKKVEEKKEEKQDAAAPESGEQSPKDEDKARKEEEKARKAEEKAAKAEKDKLNVGIHTEEFLPGVVALEYNKQEPMVKRLLETFVTSTVSLSATHQQVSYSLNPKMYMSEECVVKLSAKERMDVLQAVLRSDMVVILGHPVMSGLNVQLWRSIAFASVVFNLIIYLAFLATFTAGLLLQDAYYAIGAIFMFLSFVFFCMVCFTELKELARLSVRQYVTDVWNYYDLLLIICYALCIHVYFIPSGLDFIDPQVAPSVRAIGVMLIWTKLLYYAGMFRVTALFVLIIINMIKGVRLFMVILMIFLVSFSFSFYVVMTGASGYETLFLTMMTLFRAMVGDLSYDAIDGKDNYWCTFLFALFVFIVTTMMLNFLVALMASQYVEVLENSQNVLLRSQGAALAREISTLGRATGTVKLNNFFGQDWDATLQTESEVPLVVATPEMESLLRVENQISVTFNTEEAVHAKNIQPDSTDDRPMWINGETTKALRTDLSDGKNRLAEYMDVNTYVDAAEYLGIKDLEKLAKKGVVGKASNQVRKGFKFLTKPIKAGVSKVTKK